jgi:hypothetical protein
MRCAPALLAFSLLLPANAGAQPTRYSQLVEKLTGARQREWVFQRFISYYGEGCRQGESYTFRRDGTALLEKCESGRKVSSTHRWRLVVPSAAEAVLTIDNERYEMLFSASRSGRVQIMTLRNTAHIRTEETQDRVYRFEPS